MIDNDENSINEINFTKRCILMSVISQEKNLVLVNSFHKIPIVKLYTADSSYENFIYSKLKGAFCLLMSREKDLKNIKYFFRIYSLKDYSMLFNMEVKKEHMQYITQYKEDFYFMELRQSFLGFKFLSKDSARIFFLLLNEDPKKEVIDQNEGAKNIKVKEISKTLTKVNDYIKARLKYKFENLGTTGVKTIYNNKKKETPKKENFNTLYINDIKGIYIDTSMLPEIDILLNNLEIDDNDSSCYLFTEKKFNLEKCKKLIKNIEQNCQNNATIKHRNEQRVPITLIDKDCHTIGNTDLYAEIMTKNIINNIRTQKRLEIFQKEHKKRHRASGMYKQLYRKTKARLTKNSSGRVSNLPKKNMEKISLNNYNTEDNSKNGNKYTKFNSIYSSNNNKSNLLHKKEAKSVDKENSGKFAKDKRQINSLVNTNIFKENEEDDDNDDKGGFSYFNNSKDNKNSNNIKIMRKNNLKINKEVDVIEEKPEDEDIKGDNKKIKNNLNKKRASDNSSLSDFLMSQVKAK